MNKEPFINVIEFLRKIPSVDESIAFGEEEGSWWIKLKLDIRHELAWSVVQELGHILNYVSIEERLPTVFYPVSPPPYMNGGPGEFLSWIIENTDKDFTLDELLEWLEGRLPQPVENEKEWKYTEE